MSFFSTTIQPWLKRMIPRSKATKAYVGITTAETLVDIALVAIILSSFEIGFVKSVLERNENSVLPVYLGLFVLAHGFQFVLALDAIAEKNILQIVALLLFNTLFLAYAIIQINEIRTLLHARGLQIIIWGIPLMISLAELIYLIVIWPIYKEFGWQVYKKIGADRVIKRLYKRYQVFLCIIKFDIFFFLGFTLQLVFLVLRQTGVERGLTIAAVPVTVVFLAIGVIAVHREIKSLFWIFIMCCLAGLGYFVYKLHTIYEARHTDYRLIYKSLTVFASICFAALTATMVTGFICYLNFGKGLKEQMARSKGTNDIAKLEEGAYKLESANNSRMSID